MPLLAGTLYDPAARVSQVVAVEQAMTALDTTNLRLSFAVPGNGAVLVRLRGAMTAAGGPVMLLGVLEGSTVRARVMPIGSAIGQPAGATTPKTQEVLFVVPGLTPAANLTWDAACGIELANANATILYGGPNDNVNLNASGGFAFEVYDCPDLLGAVLYDPATIGQFSTAARVAMTALDTTNLRITFTAPSTGNVLVRIRCNWAPQSGSTYTVLMFGVLDGATVVGRATPCGGFVSGAGTNLPVLLDTTFVAKGLTPGNSYTWDAAIGVESLLTGSALKWGGPNNATALDAFGAFQYEIWAV